MKGHMKQLIALILLTTPALAESVTVPSGQPVEFIEMINDVEGTAGETLRFRFVAPQISRDGGTISIEASMADIDALCTDFVLPMVNKVAASPDQVIISLADRQVDFGVASPDATQIFEAYRVDDTHCIWEGF